MTAAPYAPAPQPHRRSRTPFVVAGVVVLGIVAALFFMNGGFGGGSASASASPGASAPGVVPANGNVVAEGRAVPAHSAQIASVSGGEVTVVRVAPGDTVAAGDVVLELDHAAADLQVESAKQAQAAADANVARTKAGIAQAKAAVAQAQAGIDQAQAGVKQAQGSYSAANGSVSQAIAAWNAAKAARDALPSGTPKATKRQLNAQVSQASAGISAARGQRSAASAAISAARGAVASAKAAVASAKAAVASAQTSLDAATADAARAAVAVKQAEQARDQALITSPVAGTVLSVEPAVGDLVQPGIVLVRVADTSSWQFETTDMSETSVARVQVGNAVSVTVDGLPGEEIPATVTSVSAFGEPSQGDIVFKVVAVPNGEAPAGLRWNMTVTMDIEGQAGG